MRIKYIKVPKFKLAKIIDSSVNYGWNKQLSLKQKKLPLKRMPPTEKNDFHWKELFTLKEIVPTKRNSFHKK